MTERERESGRLSLFVDRVVVVTSRCESRGLCRGLVSCKGSGCGVAWPCCCCGGGGCAVM